MKRSELKRKKAKPRARGTGCQLGRRCISIGEYRSPNWETPKRLCPKHMADVLTADLVKAEEGRCRRCGATESLQWAHVFSRRYAAVRWFRANSMALCAGCHFYMTDRPADWEQWCRDHGIDWDELRFQALNGPPMQPMFVIERLKPAPSTHTEESGRG